MTQSSLAIAISLFKEIVAFAQLAVAESGDDPMIPRYKVMALANIAENALLKIDPDRAEEWQDMVKWATKVAKELGLEAEAQEALEGDWNDG